MFWNIRTKESAQLLRKASGGLDPGLTTLLSLLPQHYHRQLLMDESGEGTKRSLVRISVYSGTLCNRFDRSVILTSKPDFPVKLVLMYDKTINTCWMKTKWTVLCRSVIIYVIKLIIKARIFCLAIIWYHPQSGILPPPPPPSELKSNIEGIWLIYIKKSQVIKAP